MKLQRIICIFSILIGGLPGLKGQDITPPERPWIDYVTVDTSNNNSIVVWTQSPSTDVEWYILYYEVETPNGWEGVRFDSVSAGFNTYTHINGGAASGSILYSVSAQDSSGNESLRTPGLHSTVFCTQEYDSCNNTMEISWNKYVGWDNDISGYIIHSRTGAGNFQTLDGIGPEDSTYLHYGIQENTDYYYLIEAVKNTGDKSLSPIARRYTYMPGPPEELLLDAVSIPSHNLAEIKFHFSDTSSIHGFRLLRSTEKSADFLAVKEFYNPTENSYTIYDSILSRVETYYYKIGSLNTCNSITSFSNTGINLLLDGYNDENTNYISWNEYEDFPDGLAEYQLYRANTDGGYDEIANTPPGTTAYSDVLTDSYNTGLTGNIQYIVQARSLLDNNYSLSDTLIINVNSGLSMPNAFTPNSDGQNDIFKPVLSFIPKDFKMIIYDRYGVSVFSSEDPFTGWDGTIEGKGMAIEGVYVYHIQFTSYNGTASRQTGKVTVLYP